MDRSIETTQNLNHRSWDAYNELLMSGSIDRFTKMFARFELFKSAADLPGEIVECGVFKGTGVLFWARLVQLFNPISRRKVVGFDTFEGFPESLNSQDRAAADYFEDDASSKGYSEESILGFAKHLGLDSRIELVKGNVVTSMRDFLQARPGFRAALVNFDLDAYEPTLAALTELWPRITPGGVLVFDEYAVREWGESNAVDEFFADKGIQLKSFPWALSPTAYAFKGRVR